MKIQEMTLPLIAFFILIGFWELTSQHFEAHHFVLPPPSAIMQRLMESPARFFYHARVTFSEMISGFILAFAVAFPFGWMMWHYRSARRVLQPLFVLIQCVPMFALAPIMVLWFGWGFLAIIVPTALMIFFPLTMNIYQGFQAVPQNMLNYFRINQASQWQLFSKLQIPWAMPYIFAGFRISAAIAGIGAIAGEWAGAQSGLGMLMLESRRATDLETTFGALIVLALMSMLLYGTIVLIEKWCTQPSRVKRLAILLAVFGLVLGGCTEQEKSTNKTRLLLDWLPNSNHVPLYVGIEKGFFKDHNIELELLKLHDPSDSIPFLVTGQTDLAVYYTTDTLQAKANGSNVEPVGILIAKPLNGFIYRKGEGIEKPEDLNGKTIGYCLSTSPRRLNYILNINRIVPADIRNVSFDLVSTLCSKQVDAVYEAYWNIECEHMRSLGFETDYFELAEFGVPNHPELIVLAKSGAKDPSFIQAFQQALQQSIDYSTIHPDEAFRLYLQANPDKAKKTAAWEEKAWYATYPLLADNQEVDVDEWNQYAAWLDTHDLLR